MEHEAWQGCCRSSRDSPVEVDLASVRSDPACAYFLTARGRRFDRAALPAGLICRQRVRQLWRHSVNTIQSRYLAASEGLEQSADWNLHSCCSSPDGVEDVGTQLLSVLRLSSHAALLACLDVIVAPLLGLHSRHQVQVIALLHISRLHPSRAV